MTTPEIPHPIAVGTVKSIDGNRVTIDDPERGEVIVQVSWHLWTCGCLRNDGGAHRVGCPVYPEGVRGDV